VADYHLRRSLAALRPAVAIPDLKQSPKFYQALRRLVGA